MRIRERRSNNRKLVDCVLDRHLFGVWKMIQLVPSGRMVKNSPHLRMITLLLWLGKPR